MDKFPIFFFPTPLINDSSLICESSVTKTFANAETYWPDEMARQEFYRPSPRGYEREVEQRLQKWRSLQEGGE